MKKSIWLTPVNLEEINRRGKETLSEHLKIEFVDLSPDSLSAQMPIGKEVLQPMGVLHGGASCALAETVGSAAANYCVDQKKQVCVGLDININHLRAVRSGNITATARPLHLGRTTQVWEIKIENEEGKLVSAARLTMAVLDKK
ncbi:MAG: hypothetical protein A3E80_06695 [Chlamydiae bacterium RIFCSPHIGHO2_12_FULL_49_9]|nr:MAG: hypothetical protein A3E80_06695 [Chlamydiae bacterium RIFCSPHIGHO2_12_FULL_49_9]